MSLLVLPASALALSGPQLLTFGDYDTETEISTQYQGQGIVFKDEYGYYPEVRWDESSYDNPVLSGTFGFGSPIGATFVTPGTTTPAAVESLAMDVGYINDVESTELIVERGASAPTVIEADEYGFDHLYAGGGGITGFQLQPVGDEPAGFVLDNLEFTIPAPPPPPPSPPVPAPSCPTYRFFDSRGSGEEKGKISQPAAQLLKGFKQRASDLHSTATIALDRNEYEARSVFSMIHPSETLNGIGALLGVDQIGAYHASEKAGQKRVRNWVSDQIMGPCGASSRLVLLGYSQGAQASAGAYRELSRGQRSRVAAVVLWGDPLYNHGDDAADRDRRAFNGTLGTRDKFPDGYKVFSYCNEHDPVCQNGLSAAQVAYYRTKEHKLYYKTDQAKNNGSAVASFLIKGR